MTCNETVRSGAITPSLEIELDFVECEQCGLIIIKK